MSEQGMLVYLFLISAPAGNGIGCSKYGMASLIEDSRMVPQTFRKGFGECLEKGHAKYDEGARVLYVPKYYKRNPVANPNGVKAIAKDFLRVPDCELKTECYHMLRNHMENRAETFLETFLETFAEPLSKPFAEHSGTISPSPSPSPSPSVTPTPTRARTRVQYSSVFEEFWKLYPYRNGKKTGKADAFREFKAALKRTNLETITSAVKQQSGSEEWQKENGAFVPDAHRWLKKSRWEDDVAGKEQKNNNHDELRQRLHAYSDDVFHGVSQINVSELSRTVSEAVEDGIPIPKDLKTWIANCGQSGAFDLVGLKIVGWSTNSEEILEGSDAKN
jgi:hypothetical protein